MTKLSREEFIIIYQASSIESCVVQAIDGELGKVKDIYIDSEQWTIRYLVVDTKRWLPSKKVLVSPISFDEVHLNDNQISIAATEEQIKHSPSVDEHEPISRKKEREINRYYNWTPYWVGTGIWGNGYNPNQIAAFSTKLEHENSLAHDEFDDDGEDHLRSANELKGVLTGYKVTAIDGNIGTVDDFLLDDDSWMIHYLIVDTGDFFRGEKVLLSPESIVFIDWANKEVKLDLKKEQVEQGPVYTKDNSIFVDENTLHRRAVRKN